jgi:hypothetical protein
MCELMRKIEIDEATAGALERRAAEQGVSVATLLKELANLATEDAEADLEQIAELDRRWAAVEGGEGTVPNDQVVEWLKSWGTADFRRWSMS